MSRIIFLVITLLLASGCSLSQPKSVKPNEKAFAEEDAYILFALRAEQIQDYSSASLLFEELYLKSNKKEYLYRSLQNDLLGKKYQQVISRVDTDYKDFENDAKLMRLKIIALVEINELDTARDLSISLAKSTKEVKDYLLSSEVYIKRQEFDLALKYLESAYTKEHDEQILDKMSIILYVNLGRKKEAIAYLETHSRMLGCSEVICKRLIAIYSNENNVDGLLSTYLHLYEVKKDDEIAKKIIQIYSYKRDYDNLLLFLEKSRVDDAVLLQLYATKKNYAKAYPLADKLYKESLDINYLGQSAIFEYENAKDKKSKKMLLSVTSKLEKVVKKLVEPTYMNYYGYILIDHDIDVKKGMLYIEKVLALEPDSAFYLDSLAWGYYKLGKCKKAKKIMDRVAKMEGGSEAEVLEHIKLINKCIKNTKGKK